MNTAAMLSRGVRSFGSQYRPGRLSKISPAKSSFLMRSSSLAMSTTSSATSASLAVHVKCWVSEPDTNLIAFYRNTIDNAKQSVLEPGISRFDVMRRIDDPKECLLVEVYKTKTGPADHKETPWYATWRDNVASMMAQPRAATKYSTLFPSPREWDTDEDAGRLITDTDSYIRQVPWTVEPFAAGTLSSSPPSNSSTSSTSSSSSDSAASTRSLVAVIVDIQVKPGTEDAFINATLNNCKNSIKESGVHRFDFMRNNDDPRNFALVEIYNNPSAAAEHKATSHYATWAAAVADMMDRPRKATRYATLFPSPLFYHTSAIQTHPGEGTDGLQCGLSNVAGNNFGFLSPKLLIGRNIAEKAIKGALTELQVTKPFIVTGKTGMSRYKDLLGRVLGDGNGAAVSVALALANSVHYCVAGEPTVEDAEAAVALARSAKCDSVLAIGGGSAIDLGKAVAALITNSDQDIYEYIEVIGKGKPITKRPVPMIAVPTTSGTGSETTKNAVLKSVKHGRKASIRHDWMLPAVAVVDPVLTISCSPDVTANVGLDTLCQLVEPFTSNAANPITDALAKEGIVRAVRSLRKAVTNGKDIQAREDLAVASVLGGLCLANAKLGAVHGFASVLGGMYEHAPHGAICAALMPAVFRKNVERLKQQSENVSVSAEDRNLASVRLARFTECARLLTGIPHATAEQGATFLEVLTRDLNISRLSSLCVGMGKRGQEEVNEIVAATEVASSTKGNPIVLSASDLQEILKAAW